MKPKRLPYILHSAFIVASIIFNLATYVGAQTETVLYTFSGLNGGAGPFGGLVSDSAGNFYGTTYGGGTGNCSSGCGIVYRLSPTASGNWKKTVLHYFAGDADGSRPASSLVFDSAGNLYGTTLFGGGSNACGSVTAGCGIVFKLTPTASGVWKETILFDFSGGSTGSFPSGVIFDAAGNLYGTASGGGNVSDCQNIGLGGCGLVFKLSPTAHGAWKERVLFTFIGRGAGGIPEGAVVFDAAGNLYAVTGYGGIGCSPFGCGVAVELSPTSSGPWKETTLHQFTGGIDGGSPFSSLVFDASGNLFGSTTFGGANGAGNAFELSPTSSGAWNLTTIHSFDGSTEGSNPSPLIFDAAGNLYGENLSGGPSNCGTIFELSPSSNVWTENTLLTFTCSADGANPQGGLLFDAQGNLYGVAGNGGTFNTGVVFKLSP